MSQKINSIINTYRTVQALLERDDAISERDDAIAEIKRLKELLRENGIKTE